MVVECSFIERGVASGTRIVGLRLSSSLFLLNSDELLIRSISVILDLILQTHIAQ
jgi:hypothetical protein